MHKDIHIVERAFQIARGGACATTKAVRDRLKSEGYASVEMHINGSLATQLKKICEQSVAAAQASNVPAAAE